MTQPQPSNVIQMPRSPQTEDGHVRIANELFEAIAAYPFKPSALRVLLAILRKTYGYQKTEDDVSASQLGALCGGMSRQHVTTALNELAGQRVIHKRPGQYGSIVGINKDYSMWSGWGACSPNFGRVDSPNLGQVSETRDTDSPKLGQVDSPKLGHTKDNLPKDNQQKKKDIPPSQAPGKPSTGARVAKAGKARAAMTAEMQARFDRFYAEYPRKTDRGDAERAFAALAPSEALVDEMVEALRRMKAAGWFADRRYTKHPATWLHRECWRDEVITDYTTAELEVIAAYNDALGDVLGAIDPAIYTTARAGQIQDFRGFPSKTAEFWKVFFPWVRDNCQLPPGVGFDYLISRDGFSKVKGGQHIKP